jgi:hypothetical protein
MRKLTNQELEPNFCEWVEMTSDQPWDPHSQAYTIAEENTGNANRAVVSTTTPLQDSTNTQHADAINRASYFAEPRSIAALSVAEDNSLYLRLLATANYTNNTSAGDRLISSVEKRVCFDKRTRQALCCERAVGSLIGEKGVCFDETARKAFCCKRAAGSLIGDCCENCVNGCFNKSTDQHMNASLLELNKTKTTVSKEELSVRWGIGQAKASNTLDVMTQKGVRKPVHPVTRRFRTSQPHIRKSRLTGPFYSDTCFFTAKSTGQDVGAQVTTDGKGFSGFWPMRSKREANDGLVDFINNDGIPEWLIVDSAMEQGGGRNTAWRSSL